MNPYNIFFDYFLKEQTKFHRDHMSDIEISQDSFIEGFDKGRTWERWEMTKMLLGYPTNTEKERDMLYDIIQKIVNGAESEIRLKFAKK